MKVLLDESVPVQVRHGLPGHSVETVTYRKWDGFENGDLLQAAEQAAFEVFVIADKNLRYQQNLTERHIAIVELWTNHRPTLEKHLPLIAAAVDRATPGTYQIVTDPTAA